MTPKNNKTRLLYNIKFCVSFHIHQWFQLELQSGNTQSGSNWTIFELCDLAIWHMTLNKANLRDLIAATGLVISNWIQIVNFSARVTVKFDGWPKKTIAHFYTMSSFVHHFKSIGEFKLEFTVQKHSFQVDIGDMLSRVTLKIDGWTWKTIGHLFYATSTFVHHFIPIGEFKLEWQSGNAQSGLNSTIFSAVWPLNSIGHLS